MGIDLKPFKGPSPFEVNDKDIFFGRDSEIEELVSAIISHSAVLLYAQSGAGKTSLVNAGVIPELQKEGFEILPIARVKGIRRESLQQGSLANIFIANSLMSLSSDIVNIEGLPTMTVASYLEKWQAETSEDANEQPLVIFFDQLEELFTSHQHRWRDRTGFFEQVGDVLKGSPTILRVADIRDTKALLDSDKNNVIELFEHSILDEFRMFSGEATAGEEGIEDYKLLILGELNRLIQGECIFDESVFLDVNLREQTAQVLAENPSGAKLRQLNRMLLEDAFPGFLFPAVKGNPYLRIVFVIREDFVAKLDPYTQHLPEKLSTRIRLERLKEKAAIEAIRGPISKAGRSIDVRVAEHLVRDLQRIKVESDTGEVIEIIGEYIEPVQLQVVCQSLWERLPADKDTVTKEDIEIFGDVTKALSDFYEDAIRGAIKQSNVKENNIRNWVAGQLITADSRRGTVHRGINSTEGLDNRAIDALEDIHLIRSERRAGSRWYELTHDRLIEPIQQSNQTWKDKIRSRRLRQILIPATVIAIVALIFLALSLISVESRQNASATQYAQEVNVTTTAIARIEATGAKQTADIENVLIIAEATRGQATAQAAQTQAVYSRATATAESRLLVLEQRVSKSRELASQSLGLLDEQLELALLLGVEALRFSETYEAWNSLLTALERNINITFSVKEGPLLTSEAGWYSLAYSSDGIYLASGGDDGLILLWGATTYRWSPPALKGHTAEVLSLDFSPSEDLLASGSVDRSILIWDLNTRRPLNLPRMSHDSYVTSVAFSPDGRLLASGSRDGTVRIWNAGDGKLVGIINDHEGTVWSVAWSPDGTRLVSGSSDQTARVWDLKGVSLNILRGHTGGISAVDWSPDGQLIATGSYDAQIRLWDANTGRLEGQPLTEHTNVISDLAFSPTGKYLLSTGFDNRVILWDVDTRQSIKTFFSEHEEDIQSNAFSPEGMTFATADKGGKIFVWEIVALPSLGYPTLEHLDEINSVVFSPDGIHLASASDDHAVYIWDIKTREVEKAFYGHGAEITAIAFSIDGNRLISGDAQGNILIRDMQDGRVYLKVFAHEAGVRQFAINPEGNHLASSGGDGVVRIWDIEKNVQMEEIHLESGSVNDLLFTADGRYLITASDNGDISIWDSLRFSLEKVFKAHTGSVTVIAIDPEGEILASGGDDNSIKLWSLETYEVIGAPLVKHDRPIRNIAFSPDGRFLVSSSEDGSIRLWDRQSKLAIAGPLLDRYGPVRALALNEIGNLMVSGDASGTIIWWDFGPENWIEAACNLSERSISPSEWDLYVGREEPYGPVCP